MIKSLIQAHFNQKIFQDKHKVELDGQDLIRGKGKGTVILLHGVPDVGKTATAEAVAQKWERPLFLFTCGDLGVTTESVERILKKIFCLANRWDCILFLDEADVFITERREVGDLQRNGLVSGKSTSLETHGHLLIARNSIFSHVGILQRDSFSHYEQTRGTGRSGQVSSSAESAL